MDFQKFFYLIEEHVEKEIQLRREMGDERSLWGEIVILGHFSLLANQAVNGRFPKEYVLFATKDVDAIIKGEWLYQQALREVAKRFNLVVDDLSSEIWIPPESKFDILYQGQSLNIKAIDPESALLAKAIKAKEKNRILIIESLKIFGNSLAERIEHYGGDLSYFNYRKVRG